MGENRPHLFQIYDLHEFGLIKITGKEANVLLQGQLTCDINQLKIGSTRLSAHLNPRGRIISLFYIYHCEANSFYLFLPKENIPLTIIALKKYAVFYQVEIKDLSADLIMLACVKDMPHLAIDQIINFNIPHPLQPEQMIYQIFAYDSCEIEFLYHKLKEKNEITCGNSNNFSHLNIMAGIPNIYPETSEKWLPHEINLPSLQAIDFNKGCYTGQEIVARMHYLGKVKTEMYYAFIESELPLKRGADIYSSSNDKIIPSGMIVDCSLDNNNHYHTLIITDKNHAKENHLFLKPNQHHFRALKRT